MYVFTPPGRVEKLSIPHGLFGRMSMTRGVSLLKEEGEVAPVFGAGPFGMGPFGMPTTGVVYRQVEDPSPEEIEAAARAYLGGRVYEVDAAEAALLVAAGYGEWVQNFGQGYGVGPYGVGPYGGA